MNSRTKSILICCLAFALPTVPTIAQQPAGPPNERKASPTLEVQTADGKALKVHQMHGGVVLLDFMTTVCPTCKLASAGIQRLYQELGPKGFHPIAIALNVESAAPLKDYMREHGLTFPFGTVPRGVVATFLSHPADRPMYVPTIVLLDRRGRTCFVEVGWTGEEALRNRILKLLAE